MTMCAYSFFVFVLAWNNLLAPFTSAVVIWRLGKRRMASSSILCIASGVFGYFE